MGEIRALPGLSALDRDARLQVEESMTSGQHIVIGGFGPVTTGFGNRLNVPLSEEQMEGDPGSFLELTYEQAMDLNAELATRLAGLAEKR